MRPEEPEAVKEYRDRFKEIALQKPPACCHTCEEYTEDGYCRQFQMKPPEDFAATIDACPEYFEEIPF